MEINTLQGWNEVGGDKLLFRQLPVFTPGRSSAEGHMAQTPLQFFLALWRSPLDQITDISFFSLKPQKLGRFLRKSICKQEENIETYSHLIFYLKLLSYAPKILVV